MTEAKPKKEEKKKEKKKKKTSSIVVEDDAETPAPSDATEQYSTAHGQSAKAAKDLRSKRIFSSPSSVIWTK